MEPSAQPVRPRPVRPAPTEEGLVHHGVYQIATGKWPPGERLPSVRRAEELWEVDRRVVLRAWRRLEELGLVVRRDRSGYYVSGGPELGRLSRHRHELERLFERFAGEVERETGLAAVGAFRYLAHLAEVEAHERPPCAFVECTETQARGHADEVFARLGVPCLAATLDQVTPGLRRLPDHVRTLLVSAFHAGELRAALADTDRTVLPVPIEVSTDLAAALPSGVGRARVVETDETEAGNILADVEKLELPLELEPLVGDDPDALLEELLAGPRPASLALLSPRVWGTVEERWRDHALVRQIAFRVQEAAWPAVADAVGLPLGFLA